MMLSSIYDRLEAALTLQSDKTQQEIAAMLTTIPETMPAIAIEQFGGVEQLKLMMLSVPEVGAGEILIRMEAAEIGAWTRSSARRTL
jgi:hypothetical protein